MNNPLTEVLPAKARKYVYYFYGLLGVAFGATQVGYATANVDQPTALFVAFAVFGYLGTALGLVAGANTPTEPEEPVDVNVVSVDGDHEGPYVGG